MNALDPDSDNDGLYDGTELGVTMPPADTDLGAGHFVPDADGGATTTNPLEADTDMGGVSDGAEDTNLNGAIEPGELDPNDPSDDAGAIDTDGDGLTDDLEIFLGTDPMDADSDDDGVVDGQEPNPSDDTDGDGIINALDPDSDDDGILDGTELGLDCSNPDSGPDCVPDGDSGATTTSPLDPDTDDGGVPDGDEDTDHDGVVDEGETDPNDPSDDGGSGTGGAGGTGGTGAGGSGNGSGTGGPPATGRLERTGWLASRAAWLAPLAAAQVTTAARPSNGWLHWASRSAFDDDDDTEMQPSSISTTPKEKHHETRTCLHTSFDDRRLRHGGLWRPRLPSWRWLRAADHRQLRFPRRQGRRRCQRESHRIPRGGIQPRQARRGHGGGPHQGLWGARLCGRDPRRGAHSGARKAARVPRPSVEKVQTKIEGIMGSERVR